MERKRCRTTCQAAAVILMWNALALAAAERSAAGPAVEAFEAAAARGFIAERLAGSRLRLWKSLTEIVFAQDASGSALHPRIVNLWREVEASGCRMFIELADTHPRVSSRAGEFRIEEIDAYGRIQAAVIRLYLGTIDRARLRASCNPGEGFHLFRGLNKEERYAVVLGHELVHATAALRDLAYARTMVEFWRETEAYYRMAGRQRTSDRLACLQRITALSDALERVAESMDTALWSELHEARRQAPRFPDR